MIRFGKNFKILRTDILQLTEGAYKARGLTVIIDVFRAFSVACYLYHRGVEKIIPVGDINMAYKLKEQHPEYILIGERNEKKPEGFSYGNSPSAIMNLDFTGKTVVHTTSSGTQGLVNAVNAEQIITGSFVNAGAIVRYIKKQNPERVSLVCMGYATLYPVEEDTFCAEYIRDSLEGRSFNYEEKLGIIKRTSGSRFFLPENQSHAPKEDFYLCTDLNRFSFVLRARRMKENFRLEKIPC